VDPRFELVMSFSVPGDPHGKQSVRVSKGRGRKAAKSKVYELHVAGIAGAAAKRDGLVVPIRRMVMLDIVAVVARPKSIPVALRIPVTPGGDLSGRLFAPVKPDWDNIAKSVGDGLQLRSKICAPVLKDDGLAVRGKVDTVRAAVGEKPHVEVSLWVLRDPCGDEPR
jgi:Holliday junction resolvase RusA-like endonuclease